MQYITITPNFTSTCEKSSCDEELIYFIQAEPFRQTHRILKTINTWNEQVHPGQYRISLQYFPKTKYLPITVSLNDTSITETLTFGKFLYFEVTREYTIVSGNIEEFTRRFNERRINIEKEKVNFWNNYWYFLHTLAFNYPKNPTQEHKNDAEKLFNNINNNGLPCTKCATHYAEYIKQKPFTKALDSSDELFKYFFDLHNDVNRRNNKREFSLNEAYKKYEKMKPILENRFKISIDEIINTHKMHTLPQLMNGSFRVILKREFKLF